MRVALVCGSVRAEQDGVAAYVQRLAAALGEAGVVTELLAGRRWGPRDALATARAARWSGADLAHVQFAPSAYGYRPWVGLLPPLLGGLPLVTTLHEYDWWAWQPRLAPLWARAERAGRWDRETLTLVPASRALVVTNPAHAGAVRARFPTRRPSPAMIPIGANVEDSYPGDRAEARRALGIPAGDEVLAFFGFVHPVKGLRHLLDAVAELRRRRPRVRLLVVGGVESLALRGGEAAAFEAELRARVAALGLAGRVAFTGFRPAGEVSRLLRAADVAVLPFTHGVTTKSGALLTCLAHRLPVVATRPEGGPDPELVDGRSVLLAERRDAPTLARAVERLLADPALRRRLSAAGGRVLAPRAWPAVARAHLRVYEAALRRPDRGAGA